MGERKKNSQSIAPVRCNLPDALKRLECVTVTVLGHSELQEQEHEGKKKIKCKDRLEKKCQQATPPFPSAHQMCDDATSMFLSEMFGGIAASRLKFYKYPINTS